MLEAAVMLVGLAVVVVVSLTVVMLPWQWLLAGGLAVAVVGLMVGAPAGLRYHLKLRDALSASGPLPGKWWLHPVRYHGVLGEDDLASVRIPFMWGAAGFVISLAGCALSMAGLVRALL